MIESVVLSYSLILARTGTFVSVLPILGGQAVPHMVKVGLALALAAFFFCLFGTAPALPYLDAHSERTWLLVSLALGREALLGAFLGLAMGLVLLPAHIAGEYLSQEMGLALGAQTNPLSATPAGTVSQIFDLVAAVLFVGMNGHHLFLAALHALFTRWPVGSHHPVPVAGLLATLGQAQTSGLQLIAPLGAMLFLTSITLALVSRAAPQVNVFSASWALRIAGGLAGLALLLPDLTRGMIRALGQMSQLLERLV